MSDLVKRLRSSMVTEMVEAADRIEELEAKVKEMQREVESLENENWNLRCAVNGAY